jgi:hypothetical protein
MRSLEVGSSTSGTADAFVLGDSCFISYDVMASDPYNRRKGVNPVSRHSVVFRVHTTSGSWSAHLPFLLSRSLFLIAVKSCHWHAQQRRWIVGGIPRRRRAWCQWKDRNP